MIQVCVSILLSLLTDNEHIFACVSNTVKPHLRLYNTATMYVTRYRANAINIIASDNKCWHTFGAKQVPTIRNTSE